MARAMVAFAKAAGRPAQPTTIGFQLTAVALKTANWRRTVAAWPAVSQHTKRLPPTALNVAPTYCTRCHTPTVGVTWTAAKWTECFSVINGKCSMGAGNSNCPVVDPNARFPMVSMFAGSSPGVTLCEGGVVTCSEEGSTDLPRCPEGLGSTATGKIW